MKTINTMEKINQWTHGPVKLVLAVLTLAFFFFTSTSSDAESKGAAVKDQLATKKVVVQTARGQAIPRPAAGSLQTTDSEAFAQQIQTRVQTILQQKPACQQGAINSLFRDIASQGTSPLLKKEIAYQDFLRHLVPLYQACYEQMDPAIASIKDLSGAERFRDNFYLVVREETDGQD